MLHARKDYNKIQDPENKIPANEPVFLLRGQDKFAPELLLRWAAKLRLDGGQPEIAEIVENHAQKMIEWQKNKKVKLPDIPDPDLEHYQYLKNSGQLKSFDLE